MFEEKQKCFPTVNLPKSSYKVGRCKDLPSVYIFGKFFELGRIIAWISGYERLREIIQVIDVRLVLMNIRVEVLKQKESHYLQ